ncbi:PP2C family protein-serine/threonine phosphatase [Streptomyces sp. NPDC092296]|uniref:PP2C family protein-serine/threonine phosphatase n=1 Tax=Streptomyces sp. NPDC092296 TaxID=3366012 RepID=UPI0037F6A033
MTADDRVCAARRALQGAVPDALVTVLDRVLSEHFRAVGSRLLLIDYSMSLLCPVRIAVPPRGGAADGPDAPGLPGTGDPAPDPAGQQGQHGQHGQHGQDGQDGQDGQGGPEDGGAPPEPVNGTPAGRVFAAQRPEATGHTLLLPVTVRGDRQGVLEVRLPQPPGPTELAELAEVAGALGHALVVADRETDLYLRARRPRRLTLAAEMQWQLLPGRSCERPEYSLGAHLEPAYAVHGDHYDWTAEADQLTVSVTNGMDRGTRAAALTGLAVGALRNARRLGERIPIAHQASLADQAIYGMYGGKSHVSTLLLHFDLETGRVSAVDAGSPKVLRLRDGRVDVLELDAQLPLGMFEETHYVSQELPVRPGDRLVVVSDGVHGARSPRGELFGDRMLLNAISGSRMAPPAEAARLIIRQVGEHEASDSGRGPADDAVVVVVDWRGR